jgi:hypothetical protein
MGEDQGYQTVISTEDVEHVPNGSEAEQKARGWGLSPRGSVEVGPYKGGRIES